MARAHAGHVRADQSHRSLASLAGALALVAAAGVLAGAVMHYLNLYGPSGNAPHPWSYTGNGALAVLAYCPLILMAGWTVLALAERAYRPRIACLTALIALAGGVAAGVVNEIGLVGQLPDFSRTHPIYGVVVNTVMAALALAVGLALLKRLARPGRQAVIAAVVLALATTIVGVWLSLTDAWYSLPLTQGILVLLTIVTPSLLGTPRTGPSVLRQRRLLTALGFLLVPLALIGGFVLESFAAPLLGP